MMMTMSSLSIYLLYELFIILHYFRACASSGGNHVWRITIHQQKAEHALHIAEVHFYFENRILDRSKFHFSASSYVNAIHIGRGAISGPPEAANDGNKDTFYHSGYDDGHGGFAGQCCPDQNLTLTITSYDNSLIFDTIRIINRQDVDSTEKHFFSQLIGSIVTVYNAEDNAIFTRVIESGLPSYNLRMSEEGDEEADHLPTEESSMIAQKWIEDTYFQEGKESSHLWIDNELFYYDEAHLFKYSRRELTKIFHGKTVLAIGDSTVRETLYHLIYLVTGNYPSLDGIYPPTNYQEDFDGICKGAGIDESWGDDKNSHNNNSDSDSERPLDCFRDWHLNGSHWQFQFVGHLSDARKDRLEKAFPPPTTTSSSSSGGDVDVILFGYNVWPAEFHKFDSNYYRKGLQWLVHFIRRRFGPLVPVFWLGPLHTPFYAYQKPIVQSVLGLQQPHSSKEEADLMDYRTRCGGLGRLSITPIERYGLGKLRDLYHFHSPSYEVFAQMVFNWFCDCMREPSPISN